jgi:hypothetical protein
MSAPESMHLPFCKRVEAARWAAGEALDSVGGAVLGAIGDGVVHAGEHRGELGGHGGGQAVAHLLVGQEGDPKPCMATTPARTASINSR